MTPDETLPELKWREPNGPWTVQKSFSYRKDGKLVRVWKQKSLAGVTNKLVARRKAIEILAQWGQRSEPEDVELFRQAEVLYRDSRRNAAKATQDSIKYAVAHLVPFFGPKRINDITINHWAEYVAARRAEAPDCALFNEWKTFTGIMNLMHSQGHRGLKLSVPNPDADRDLPEVTFTEAELEALFAHANPTTRLQMALGYDLFMRPGEIKGLEWDRVDLVEREVPGVGKTFGRIVLQKSHTKTRDGRVIPLTREIAQALRERKRAQVKRYGRRLGGAPQYVFPSRGDLGRPVSDYGKAFETARRNAGIETKGTPYTLRHTGLTNAYRRAKAEAGMEGTKEIPPSAIKIALVAGHSIHTAMTRYLHLRSEDLVGVVGLTGGLGGRALTDEK